MLELFKNFCMVFVIMQLFIVAAILIMIAVSDKISGNAEQGGGAGRHALCALTGSPCIYKDDGRNVCDDCPEAQKHFYQEEKNVDKVRGFQDEGRAD